MKYAYLDEHGYLKIASKKEDAEKYGKFIETDFPEIQGKPCDGTPAKEIPGGYDYSGCKMYDVKSLEEAYAVSEELGKLYKSVM